MSISQWPLRDTVDHLPVGPNQKAWFHSRTLQDMVWSHTLPALHCYYVQEKGIPRQEVETVVLLDNDVAHPTTQMLRSKDSRILRQDSTVQPRWYNLQAKLLFFPIRNTTDVSCFTSSHCLMWSNHMNINHSSSSVNYLKTEKKKKKLERLTSLYLTRSNSKHKKLWTGHKGGMKRTSITVRMTRSAGAEILKTVTAVVLYK